MLPSFGQSGHFPSVCFCSLWPWKQNIQGKAEIYFEETQSFMLLRSPPHILCCYSSFKAPSRDFKGRCYTFRPWQNDSEASVGWSILAPLTLLHMLLACFTLKSFSFSAAFSLSKMGQWRACHDQWWDKNFLLSVHWCTITMPFEMQGWRTAILLPHLKLQRAGKNWMKPKRKNGLRK